MNDNVTAHTANIIQCLAKHFNVVPGDIAELVRSGMDLAHAEGVLDGVREVQAAIETERAIGAMRGGTRMPT